MGSRLESNSKAINKRIQNHTFQNEEGDEYEGSKFGGFSEYFRRKKIKLQNLDAEIRQKSANNPQIFRGITVHVNGYTQPSLNDLHRLIASHGGGFLQYLDGKTTVTHIVASNLTPKKVVEFKNYRIVKPAWVVDSVNAGRLLPWDAYRLVDEGASQKILQFKDGDVVSQVNDLSRGYRGQTATSWYTHQLQEDAREGVDSPSAKSPSGSSARQLYPLASFSSYHAERDQDITSGRRANTEVLDREEVETNEGTATLPRVTFVDPDGREMFVSENEFDADGVRTDLVADETAKSTTLEYPEACLDGSTNESPRIEKTSLTAEEHNTVLLSDPRIRKSSVLNPDFLEQYYRESRLHHLSTWKADLKSQLQKITSESTSSQKMRLGRVHGARRYILHVDFDSFFVAVSLKSHPQDVDKPACVAHGTGPNSEIASCNYPARARGVKNGMWMKRANELCSDLKVLPYDFPAYEACSRLFYDAILATGGLVQSVSIDEALVDVTAFCLSAGGSNGVGIREGSEWREQAKADEIAQTLRTRVKEATGCAVSVGIGGNILLAKLALRRAKPAGQHQVKPEEVLDFLAEHKVQDLPGVAYSIGGKLEEIGVTFVKDIRQLTKEKLVNTLGPKTGEKLWNYSRGIDQAEVGELVLRKSVSAEVNWGVRFETQEQAEEFVDSLCGELSKRLVKEQVKGRHLTMKIMRRAQDAPLDPPKHLGHGRCDTFNKSVVLGVATNAQEALCRESLSILRGFGFSPGELRGIGVQMTKLVPLKASESVSAGSQRRLQFKSGPPETTPEKSLSHMIPADVAPPAHSAVNLLSNLSGQKSETNKRALNVLGTQFLLPSQVDPDALAALPPDIKAKLSRQMGIPGDSQIEPKATYEYSAPKEQNKPHSVAAAAVLPNPSQLDHETLNELPQDMRDEILAYYEASNQRSHGQSVLPQSPHKGRVLPSPRKPTTVRGKRGGSLLSRLKASSTRSSTDSTLTQANFVTRAARHGSKDMDTSESEDGGAEIAPDFLDALPDDIRHEVLAQHRARVLRRQGGLQIQARRNLERARPKTEDASETDDAAVEGEDGQLRRVLKLAPREPQPTFSTRKLSALEDLRQAISMWYGEFASEGPYKEDVSAITKYLSSVVMHERDVSKASSVLKWLEWVIDNGNATPTADLRWRKAFEETRERVKASIRDRGFSECDL